MNLNLASQPVRNRRFFRASSGFLVIFLALLTVLSAFVFFKYRAELASLRASIVRVQNLTETAKREEVKSAADVAGWEKSLRSKVDLVNTIILRKSFSWTGLLSLLEEALPSRSFITFLSPRFTGEASADLKMRVVSPALEDLLALVENLKARDFRNIRVESETVNERGQLVSEITVSYERSR